MIDKVPVSQAYTTPSTPRVASTSGERRPAPQEQKASGSSQGGEKAVYEQPTKEQVVEIVDGMNKFLQPSSSSLKFEYHEALNEYFVTVVDEVTKEVIKEIPSKKLLDMYAAMTEYVGLMVDKKI